VKLQFGGAGGELNPRPSIKNKELKPITVFNVVFLLKNTTNL